MAPRFRLDDVQDSMVGSEPRVSHVAQISYSSSSHPRCDNGSGQGNCEVADLKGEQRDLYRCDCDHGSTSPGCAVADSKRTQEDVYAKAA